MAARRDDAPQRFEEGVTANNAWEISAKNLQPGQDRPMFTDMKSWCIDSQ